MRKIKSFMFFAAAAGIVFGGSQLFRAVPVQIEKHASVVHAEEATGYQKKEYLAQKVTNVDSTIKKATASMAAAEAPKSADATTTITAQVAESKTTVVGQTTTGKQFINTNRITAAKKSTAAEQTTAAVQATAKKPITPVFKKQTLPKSIYQKMLGVTIHKNSRMKRTDLSYLTLTYYGYDNKNHVGHLVVAKDLAEDVLSIFQTLLEAKFPIEKMVLIDAYKGDDEKSMRANNSSAFNDRMIKNSNSISNHQLGRAIDINPLYNPYIKFSTNVVQPSNARKYLDRTKRYKGTIAANDVCVKAFKERGFTWGGDWNSVKDYQHFEKAKK